jgi:hypothetical protein
MRKRLIGISAFLVAIMAIPVLAFDTGGKIASLFESDLSKMKAGEFEWHPELAPAGQLSMTINLHTQGVYVYRNAVLIGVSTISSGRSGHLTPTGTFAILEKQKVHRSKKYNNAPMPYMQRLTSYGIALHGGNLPGYPASHGCVRLPHAFAEDLFKETNIGMKVIITNTPPGGENTKVSSKVDPRTGVQSCDGG